MPPSPLSLGQWLQKRVRCDFGDESTFSGISSPCVALGRALPAKRLSNQNQPSFGLQFAGVPGVNPDGYEPVLLTLEPTSSNFRRLGATQAKQDELEASAADWGMYSSFVEERVTVTSQKTASGTYQL